MSGFQCVIIEHQEARLNSRVTYPNLQLNKPKLTSTQKMLKLLLISSLLIYRLHVVRMLNFDELVEAQMCDSSSNYVYIPRIYKS